VAHGQKKEAIYGTYYVNIKKSVNPELHRLDLCLDPRLLDLPVT
jgi:hypothetical protein